MSAIAAVRRSIDTLQRNPVLFVGALTFAVLSVPNYAFQALHLFLLPILWAAVAFFLSPFLMGGLLGMAHEGLTNRTSLSTFVAEGKENYVNLLLVNILLTIIIFAVGIVGVIGFAIVGVFAFGFSAAGGIDASMAALVVFVIAMLVYALVVLAIIVLLQFSNQAVVVDDVGPVDALKQSYRTVRSHALGSIGVAAIAFLLGSIAGLPAVLASFALQPGPTPFSVPLSDTTAYVILFGWGTLTTVVLGAFTNTMLVAFYDANAPSE